MEDKKEFEFNDKENLFSKTEVEAPEEESIALELPHTIKLLNPISVGKNTYEEITFRNPLTVGMMKHIPAGESAELKIGHFVPIISGMTGLNTVVIEALTSKDFTQCTEVAIHFL